MTGAIVGACIEVHRHLGPGLLESAYERCVEHELRLRGFRTERQRRVPFVYKGLNLECGYRADLVVEDLVLVEIKAIEQLRDVHSAQVITYLRLLDLPTGLLVNFNVWRLIDGVRRLTKHPRATPPGDPSNR